MSEGRVVERLDRRTIGKQITLPFTKAVEISIKSLRTRFRRSLITVGLIMLAIAFLMTILTTNAFENALVGRAKARAPWGEEVMPDLGQTGYRLDADDGYHRITRTAVPGSARFVESAPELVESDEEKEVAKKYVEKVEAWRAETNDLKATLGKRMPESLEASEAAGADIGITPQQWWLIILSLTVAVVGIVNAMLMSVTERYQEIGTMKCLGALDSFIIRLFLLESVFQGTAGTIVGTVLGCVLIFLHTVLAYGWITVKTFPMGAILFYGVVSIVIGFLLSVFGALLPAYRAAKMQPVEAMRVEE